MDKITMTSKEFGLLIESGNVADLLLMAADAFEGLGGKVFGAPDEFRAEVRRFGAFPTAPKVFDGNGPD